MRMRKAQYIAAGIVLKSTRDALEVQGFEVNEIPETPEEDIIAIRDDKVFFITCRAFKPDGTLTPDIVARAVDYTNIYKAEHPGTNINPVLLVGENVPQMVMDFADSTGVKIAKIQAATSQVIETALNASMI